MIVERSYIEAILVRLQLMLAATEFGTTEHHQTLTEIADEFAYLLAQDSED